MQRITKEIITGHDSNASIAVTMHISPVNGDIGYVRSGATVSCYCPVTGLRLDLPAFNVQRLDHIDHEAISKKFTDHLDCTGMTVEELREQATAYYNL